MRKFLPALFSGLLAVSFSQLAAAQSSSTQAPDNRTSADTGIKSESGTGASAGANAGTSGGSAASGQSSSDTQKPAKKTKAKSDKKHGKAQQSSTKSDKDTTAAGSTSGSTAGTTSGSAGAGASSNDMPRKPDSSAAPMKSDANVRSGAKSPTTSEKSD